MKSLILLFFLLSQFAIGKDYCYMLSGMKRYGEYEDEKKSFYHQWHHFKDLEAKGRCKVFHSLKIFEQHMLMHHLKSDSSKSTELDEIYIFSTSHGGRCGYIALDEEDETIDENHNYKNLINIFNTYSVNNRLAYISASCYGGDLLLRSINEINDNFKNLCINVGAMPGHTGGINVTNYYKNGKSLAHTFFNQFRFGVRVTPTNIYSSAYVFEELGHYQDPNKVMSFLLKLSTWDKLNIYERIIAKVLYRHGPGINTDHLAGLATYRDVFDFSSWYDNYTEFKSAFDAEYIEELSKVVSDPLKCKKVAMDVLKNFYHGMTFKYALKRLVQGLENHPEKDACYNDQGKFLLGKIVPENEGMHSMSWQLVSIDALYELEPSLYLQTNFEAILAGIEASVESDSNWSDLLNFYPYNPYDMATKYHYENIDIFFKNIIYEYSRDSSIKKLPRDLDRYNACNQMVPNF